MTYEEDLERVNHKLKWDGIPVPKVVAKVVAIRGEFQPMVLDQKFSPAVTLAIWVAMTGGSLLCLTFAFKVAAMCWTLLLRYAR